MAANTPVLERSSATEKVPARNFGGDYASEQAHNARIKDTYARLINPNNTVQDVFGETLSDVFKREEAAMARPAERTDRDFARVDNENVANAYVVRNAGAESAYSAQGVANVHAAQAASVASPYLVHNARADAAIFRAESAVNAAAGMQTAASATYAEDESEDLRPTSTTIQYQTVGEAKAAEKIYEVSEAKKPLLGKKERTIVAIFVAVVVALLTLVIINSAVIASLDSQISDVEGQINSVKEAITAVNTDIGNIISQSADDLLA